MKQLFETFILELIHDVPIYVYWGLISLTCVCLIIFFVVLNRKTAIRISLQMLFWEYLFLIYSNTVFFRRKMNYIWQDFTPFWSYKALYSGDNPKLIPEITLNIGGFVPLGFLMAVAFRNLKWWQVILTGFLISVTIESLQYFFKLGITEFDDVFNNTLGVTTGYALFVIIYFTINKIRRIPK